MSTAGAGAVAGYAGNPFMPQKRGK